MAHEYQAKTVESVYAIDEPAGVTWLTGMSFNFDEHPDYQPHQESGSECDCCNRWGVFPISTAELIGKKGVGLVEGDMFLLKCNLSAGSPADVKPKVIEYKLPISDEEFAAWMEGK